MIHNNDINDDKTNVNGNNNSNNKCEEVPIHDMKMYKGVKLLLLSFLTFTLDTDGW